MTVYGFYKTKNFPAFEERQSKRSNSTSTSATALALSLGQAYVNQESKLRMPCQTACAMPQTEHLLIVIADYHTDSLLPM